MKIDSDSMQMYCLLDKTVVDSLHMYFNKSFRSQRAQAEARSRVTDVKAKVEYGAVFDCVTSS